MKRLIGGAAAAVAIVIALLLVATWQPSGGHAVHTAGAIQLSPKVYPLPLQPGRPGFFGEGKAGESLDAVECATWQGYANPGRTCDPNDPSWNLFPTATQSPHTLYLTWYGCIEWIGHGPLVPWEGFNFEYLPASRSVVVHCYKAAPYIYVPERLMGVAAIPYPNLYAITDSSFGSGQITIEENDRFEHLVGDQTYSNFQLGTATIA